MKLCLQPEWGRAVFDIEHSAPLPGQQISLTAHDMTVHAAPPAAVDQQYSGKASGICSSGRKRSPADPGAYSRSEMILTPFFPVK